jgi:magnesium transporter
MLGAMNPTAQLLEPEVCELIKDGRYSELRDALHGVHPADIADLFAQIEPAQAALGFRFLLRDDAAAVFAYFTAEKQQELISTLGQEEALRVVEAMDADDRARLVDELPEEVAQRLVASLAPETRKVTQAILGYPLRSVGRFMTPDYVRIRPEWTVGQALEHIRKNGRDAETINVVYVIDDQGRLIDDLRLRQLIFADPAATVESQMNNNFVTLRADQDREEAVAILSRYDRTALPVVDSRGVLVGIVTHDDVADVAQQIATEDMQKMGGMEALDEPYMQITIWRLLKKRGGWLAALFLGEMLTASAMTHYDEELHNATVLALFLPLIISSGGNSGSQASTLIIRAMALREITLGDWLRVFRRELICGVILGVFLGAIGLCRILLWRWLGWDNGKYTEHYTQVGIAVGVALIGVVLWGSLCGSMLPFLLRRLKLDPATISAPLVATLVDVTGLIIYFSSAMLILRGTLL